MDKTDVSFNLELPSRSDSTKMYLYEIIIMTGME